MALGAEINTGRADTGNVDTDLTELAEAAAEQLIGVAIFIDEMQDVSPSLIGKGLIYAPEHGQIAYTVPGMAQFITGQLT